MATTNLPRDVFLYLLAIITLVAVAVSFGIVVFQIINVYIPDIISDPYSPLSSYLSTMRSSLAALVIILPVFLWVSWFLRKDIAKFPEKKELKIRKWLLYLTLFVTALVIIGDLVTLVQSFLEGELSQRFVIKIFTVLFIAGSIFLHYLSELKEDDKKFRFVPKFDWVVVSVVVAVAIGGFFIAGTPQNQRLVRLDERRVGDLQSIQWQLINYWQKKESLPASISELADPLGGFIVPRDPATGADYDYRTIDKLTFELCAVFDTVSLENQNGSSIKTAPMMPVAVDTAYPEYQNVWWHGQGKVCFERKIDPELYPSLKDGVKPRPL